MEAVVAVGEMAEMALGAMEWRHERKLAKDVTREWDWAEVESDLDIQRRENARLKATIQMYEQAFQQLHKQKMETGTISVDRSMAVRFVLLAVICRGFVGFLFIYIFIK